MVTDAPLIAELQRWFDSLWLQTSPASLKQVEILVEQLNTADHAEMVGKFTQGASLDSRAQRVRAKYAQLLENAPIPFKEADVKLAANTAQHDKNGKEENSILTKTTLDISQTSSTVTEEVQPSQLSTTKLRDTLPAGPRKSIEEVISLFVEQNSSAGFSLHQVHAAARKQGPADTKIRDTYYELLNYCASLPQSLFMEEAINRLVFQDGLFVQSNKTRLDEALRQYDLFIEALICVMSFNTDTQIEYGTITQGGLSRSHQAQVVAGMANRGMLQGKCATYTLDINYTWTRRDKLLTRSDMVWQKKILQNRHSKAKAIPTQEDWLAYETATPPVMSYQRPSDEAVAELLGTKKITTAPVPKAQVKPAPMLKASISEEQKFKEQLDLCHLHIAKRFLHADGPLRQSFKDFLLEVSRACGIPLKTLRNVVLGKLQNVPRLFYVSPDIKGLPLITITQSFSMSSALKDYPKTYLFILSEPYLRRILNNNHLSTFSSHSLTALIIPGPEGRHSSLPISSVDLAHLAIAKRIQGMDATQLLFWTRSHLTKYMVISEDAPKEHIAFVLNGEVPASYRLFMPRKREGKKAYLKLNRAALAYYPKTKSFIEDIVRESLVPHPWLEEGHPAEDKDLVTENTPARNDSPDVITQQGSHRTLPRLKVHFTIEEEDDLLSGLVIAMNRGALKGRRYKYLDDFCKEAAIVLLIPTEKMSALLFNDRFDRNRPFISAHSDSGFQLTLIFEALTNLPKTRATLAAVPPNKRPHPWISAALSAYREANPIPVTAKAQIVRNRTTQTPLENHPRHKQQRANGMTTMQIAFAAAQSRVD